MQADTMVINQLTEKYPFKTAVAFILRMLEGENYGCIDSRSRIQSGGRSFTYIFFLRSNIRSTKGKLMK